MKLIQSKYPTDPDSRLMKTQGLPNNVLWLLTCLVALTNVPDELASMTLTKHCATRYKDFAFQPDIKDTIDLGGANHAQEDTSSSEKEKGYLTLTLQIRCK